MSNEVPTCPRRAEAPVQLTKGPDRWEQRPNTVFLSCSYCGSMHPDEFMRRVEEGHVVTPTDKGYKAYIDNNYKFYYQHLDEAQRARFLALYNDRTMKLAHPGRFYILPFFARVAG